MRIEHSFDIYAKLCMPTNHFEFYVSFFFYVLVTCWVLWCVVHVILRCGKLSVRLSVCLSQPLRARFITDYLGTLSDDWKHLLLVAPKFPRSYCKFQGQWQNLVKRVKYRVFGYFLACGSQISKVIWQISSSMTKPGETGQIQGFRVFSGERMGGNGLKYHMLLYPDHQIIFWSRSAYFTNFGGILTQWNIWNVWFPYLMENAWQ